MDDLEYLTPEQIAEYRRLARTDPDKDFVWKLLEEKITFPEYGKHFKGKGKCLYTSTEIAIAVGLVPEGTQDCTYLQRIRIKIRRLVRQQKPNETK